MCNGEHKGPVVSCQIAQCMNWFHPFLWARIDKMAKWLHFDYKLIPKLLEKENEALYARLHPSTVFRWLAPCKTKWSNKTLESIKQKRAECGKGRVGVLKKHMDIVEGVKQAITSLHTKGIPVNSILACSILLAAIQAAAPELLNNQFKCTEVSHYHSMDAISFHWLYSSKKYVWTFLDFNMKMSPHCATRAATHLPQDWEILYEWAFFRLINITKEFEIPPEVSY